MERDYDRVSTEEILERSGVSRGALYHHFPSKLDLFRAVYTASERRNLRLMAAGVPPASALSTRCSMLPPLPRAGRGRRGVTPHRA